MKVFVYGTLLTSFHNWRLYVKPMLSTGQAQLLFEAVTEASYPMIVTAERNVPAIYNCDAGNRIKGEVYDMSEGCVEALDIIEGTKEGFYTRLPLMAKSSTTGEVVECDSYFKGSGKRLDLKSSDKDLEEIKQLNKWMDSGEPFLGSYTKELHESYYVLGFARGALAGAQKSIDEVKAAMLDRTAAKAKQSARRRGSFLWEKLL